MSGSGRVGGGEDEEEEEKEEGEEEEEESHCIVTLFIALHNPHAATESHSTSPKHTH